MLEAIAQKMEADQKLMVHKDKGLWRCAIEGPGPELIEVFNLKLEKSVEGLAEAN